MAKRTHTTSVTPPSAKRPGSPMDALFDRLKEVAIGTADLINSDEVSVGVKQVLATLSAVIDTCQAVIQDLRDNKGNDNSAEEQERRRSLVFIGLPESAATRPSERVQDDREAVVKILDELGVEAAPTTTYRLGRPDPNRTTPRLVKVVLPASVHQHVALGGWKRERIRLRGLPQFRRLLVRPSLTKEQLKMDYEQRQLRRHVANANKTVPDELEDIGRQMDQNFH